MLAVDSQELALSLAHEVGFDLAGLAPLEPAPQAERYRGWIEAGRHASMEWLEAVLPLIEDPRRWAPEGRSLLVVGLGHVRQEVSIGGGGRVARYAGERDYHNTVRRSLRRLARLLREAGLVRGARSAVDDTPLLERGHAEVAGLGFSSKAANLLHPRFGPWFFIGELVLDRNLAPEPPPGPPPGSCGSCTACLDACPTGAIVAPFEVDARRCLSHATIEERGPLAHELRPSLGAWVFGCDICSEVCPWGEKAIRLAKGASARPLSKVVEQGSLVDWVLLSPEEGAFEEQFAGTPLRRPGREGLAANAALVLGNLPQEGGQAALAQALEKDPSAKVREAAAWGLVRGYGKDHGVLARVEAAILREASSVAAEGMRRSFAERD